MSTFTMCMRVYERLTIRGPRYANMACQFRQHHDGECSWAEVAADDAREIEAERASRALRGADPRSASDDVLLAVLLSVEAGDYDDDLELILSVAHGRKHARRGVRGFGGR